MTPNTQSPPSTVGVIDSGVGGLSVLSHLHSLLPQVSTIYFADQKNLPYGEKSPTQIQQYVRQISEYLIQQNVNVIVLACHAASAASLYELRSHHPTIPMIGIEPAIKPAAEQTRTGVIGVLTTRATAQGALYQSVVERFANHVRIEMRITPELVTLVERNRQATAEGRALLREIIMPMVDAGIDQLVLACTHFPFLRPMLDELLPPSVHIVDPAPAVSKQTARILGDEALQGRGYGSHQYFTSGDAQSFETLATQLLKKPIQAQTVIL